MDKDRQEFEDWKAAQGELTSEVPEVAPTTQKDGFTVNLSKDKAKPKAQETFKIWDEATGEVAHEVLFRTDRVSLMKAALLVKNKGMKKITADWELMSELLGLMITNLDGTLLFVMDFDEEVSAAIFDAIAKKFDEVATKYQKPRNTGH